jgi:hypothetical protein
MALRALLITRSYLVARSCIHRHSARRRTGTAGFGRAFDSRLTLAEYAATVGSLLRGRFDSEHARWPGGGLGGSYVGEAMAPDDLHELLDAVATLNGAQRRVTAAAQQQPEAELNDDWETYKSVRLILAGISPAEAISPDQIAAYRRVLQRLHASGGEFIDMVSCGCPPVHPPGQPPGGGPPNATA